MILPLKVCGIFFDGTKNSRYAKWCPEFIRPDNTIADIYKLADQTRETLGCFTNLQRDTLFVSTGIRDFAISITGNSEKKLSELVPSLSEDAHIVIWARQYDK